MDELQSTLSRLAAEAKHASRFDATEREYKVAQRQFLDRAHDMAELIAHLAKENEELRESLEWHEQSALARALHSEDGNK